MKFTTLSWALLMAFGANAAPTETADDLQPRAECTEPWHDGHGPVNCNEISVVFGSGEFTLHPNRVRIRTGQGANIDDYLDCAKGTAGFTSFGHESFQYTLEIQAGNTCIHGQLPNYAYDNLIIKYGDQDFNVQRSTACSKVFAADRGRRCLIKKIE
ncbi:hypothetical protein NM208_g1943 [Fusarium decemcellulare]|uniref:Uncharacterized protein n=1 Tax=Fusarium decemcellulare TaxID=57161 RepID=A0ACC1SUD7_9HYPO|nr:hypothetical protein NM208_g1943 [Fusarium decemcellulare]